MENFEASEITMQLTQVAPFDPAHYPNAVAYENPLKLEWFEELPAYPNILFSKYAEHTENIDKFTQLNLMHLQEFVLEGKKVVYASQAPNPNDLNTEEFIDLVGSRAAAFLDVASEITPYINTGMFSNQMLAGSILYRTDWWNIDATLHHTACSYLRMAAAASGYNWERIARFALHGPKETFCAQQAIFKDVPENFRHFIELNLANLDLLDKLTAGEGVTFDPNPSNQ